MNYLIVTVLAALFSVLGIAFFRQETLKSSVLEIDEEEARIEDDAQEKMTVVKEETQTEALPKEFTLDEKRKPLKRAYITAMVVCVFLVGYSQVLRYPELTMLHNAKVLACLSVLWPCAWIDAFELRIPNKIVLSGLLMRAVILCAEYLFGVSLLQYILIQEALAAGIMLFSTVLCRLIVPKSIGFGDVKLLFLMGLFLGAGGMWDAVFCAMIMLFLVSVGMLLFRQAHRNDALPFAPFIMLGTVAAALIAGI